MKSNLTRHGAVASVVLTSSGSLWTLTANVSGRVVVRPSRRRESALSAYFTTLRRLVAAGWVLQPGSDRHPGMGVVSE